MAVAGSGSSARCAALRAPQPAVESLSCRCATDGAAGGGADSYASRASCCACEIPPNCSATTAGGPTTLPSGAKIQPSRSASSRACAEAQPEPVTVALDAHDAQRHDVALAHHLARVLDAAVDQLRDVNQALDRPIDPREGAERDELGDLAGHELPDAGTCRRSLPTAPAGRGGWMSAIFLLSESTFMT